MLVDSESPRGGQAGRHLLRCLREGAGRYRRDEALVQLVLTSWPRRPVAQGEGHRVPPPTTPLIRRNPGPAVLMLTPKGASCCRFVSAFGVVQVSYSAMGAVGPAAPPWRDAWRHGLLRETNTSRGLDAPGCDGARPVVE